MSEEKRKPTEDEKIVAKEQKADQKLAKNLLSVQGDYSLENNFREARMIFLIAILVMVIAIPQYGLGVLIAGLCGGLITKLRYHYMYSDQFEKQRLAWFGVYLAFQLVFLVAFILAIIFFSGENSVQGEGVQGMPLNYLFMFIYGSAEHLDVLLFSLSLIGLVACVTLPVGVFTWNGTLKRIRRRIILQDKRNNQVYLTNKVNDIRPYSTGLELEKRIGKYNKYIAFALEYKGPKRNDFGKSSEELFLEQASAEEINKAHQVLKKKKGEAYTNADVVLAIKAYRNVQASQAKKKAEKAKAEGNDYDGSQGVGLNHQDCVPHEALNQHALIVGSTGSGKTNTLLRFIRERINNNEKVLFVDLKGSHDLIKDVYGVCNKSQKKFKYMTLTEFKPLDPVPTECQFLYNPLRNKSWEQVETMILEYSNFSQSQNGQVKESMIYQQIEKGLCDILMPLVDLCYDNISIGLLADKCNEKSIEALLNLVLSRTEEPEVKNFTEPSENYRQRLKTGLIKKEQYDTLFRRGMHWSGKTALGDEIKDLKIRNEFQTLAMKIESVGACSMNMKTENAHAIGVADIITSDTDVYLFSVDGVGNKPNANLLGRIIILDLLQNVELCKEQIRKKHKGLGVYFDEFETIANQNNLDIFNKGREFGFACLITIQNFSDLAMVNEKFARSLIGNLNTLIVHRCTDTETSKIMGESLNLGKAVSQTFQTNVESQTGGSNSGTSDKGTIAVADSFKFNPNDIRQLKRGVCCVKTLTPDGENVVTLNHQVPVELGSK